MRVRGQSICKAPFAFSWSFCGAKNMIDCRDRRLYGIQATPISWLAWTPQNPSGLTGTCHPCCTACIAMRLSRLPSMSMLTFLHPTTSYIVTDAISSPHLTISYPQYLLLTDVFFSSSIFGLTLSLEENIYLISFQPVLRRAARKDAPLPADYVDE
jgi:hypothetical protein